MGHFMGQCSLYSVTTFLRSLSPFKSTFSHYLKLPVKNLQKTLSSAKENKIQPIEQHHFRGLSRNRYDVRDDGASVNKLSYWLLTVEMMLA